jgi:hypothetical protein
MVQSGQKFETADPREIKDWGRIGDNDQRWPA